jgi:PAS domain S-box-containing protein
MNLPEPTRRRAEWGLLLIFAILSLGIVVGGAFYYRRYERHFRAEAGRQLAAIADLKADELAQYRKERLWDAGDFFKNPAFSSLVRRFFDHPEDAEALPQLQEWAAKYLMTGQYDLVCLFDAQGVIRMAVPVEPPISSFLSQNVSEILRSNRVIVQDFTRNKQDQRAYLALLAPIFDESDTNRPLGVLALRIDPETYLYPFLQRWPTPALPGETLLVRRDGNDALCLNELRFRTNTALNLRFPLANTNSAAVKAVLGQTGLVEARDYFGAPVLAAVQAVPDTPWFLVTRMNAAKVYAPLGERLRLTILFVGLLLISTALGIGAIWWYQRVRFYRERYQIAESLRESEERFRRVFEEGPTGMAMLDETFRFIRVNPAFAAMLGYSEAELQKMTFTDITHPDHVQQDVEQVRRLLRGELAVYYTEKRYVAKSGKEMWGQVQVVVVRNADGTFRSFLAIIGNITERKQAEELLRLNQERLLKVVSQTRCILSSGQVEGQEGWRERALLPESPFRWDFPVQNEEAAQKILPLELAPGEPYHQAWFRSRDPADNAQMNWNSGNAFLNDLPFYRNEFHCIDRHGIGHWMQQFVTVRKLAENRWEIFGITTDISDLKRVEAEMRESQALYHSLVNQMPAGIFRKDAKGRYVFVNSEFCRLEGMTPNQFVGRTISELGLTDAALAAKGASDHATIMQSGNPIETDEIYTSADGEKRNYHTIKSPVLDSAGKILGTQGILFDVTERQRVEQALRDSEERYRQLFELESDAIVLVDRETHRYVDVNRAAQQIYGYSREEFLQMTPEDVSAEPEKTRNHIDAGDVHVPFRWHRKKNGERFAVEITANQIIHRGRPTALVTLRDITERRRAEETLKESEVRYQRITEAITDYIFTVRVADGRAAETTHGPGCLAVTGYQAKEFANDPFLWFRMVAAEDRPGVEEQARRILAGEDPPPIEHRIVRKNGTVRWVRNTFVPHRDERGALVAYDGLLQDITERKQAEEALRESEERLRITLETTKIGSWDWDVKKDVLYASPTYYTMLGYEPDPDHVDREKWLQRVHPDDRAATVSKIQAVLAGTSLGYQYEHRIKHADGSYRWHSVIGHAVASDENGKPARLIGVRMDITERKLAEAGIAHERQLLRTLIDLLPEIFYIKDLDGRFLVVNETLAKQWGKDNPSQMLGLSDTDLFPAEQATKFRAEELKVFAGEPVINRESICVYYDGRDHTVVTSKVPFRDSQGRICGLVGIGHDITERKRADEALRASEAELSAILESTGDGILAVDRNGEKLIKTNRRYAELWRIPQSVIDAGDNNAMRNFVLNQLADPDAFLKRVHELYGTDTVAVDTLVFKDGRILERHGFPMQLDGVVIGRVWSFRDITERKRQERELMEKSSELERFTYTVSHDLKSPLVTVKTFLGYLEQDLTGSDQERVKQDVGYMHTAADKMGQLLDELLNLARVGRKMNPAERVTFKELAQEAVRLVAGRISTGGAEVQVADAAVVLQGDRPRLTEIWQNLVENACKFMGNQPKPRVEIGVERRGSEMVFFVRDNGAGIEPRYQARVFGLFEKLDPKGEGTGMGLALVKRIVEIYKGRIWVESPGLGQGANFLFTLPAAVIINPEQSS